MVRLFTADAEDGTTTGWSVTGAFTATTERPHLGIYGYKADLGNPAAIAFGLKTFTGAVGTTYYTRAYLTISALPAAGGGILMRFRTGGTPAVLVSVRLLTTGVIYLQNDAANAGVGTSTSVLALDTAYLVELAVTINAATGDDYAELRLDGATIATSSTLDLGTVAPGRYEMGLVTTAGGVNYAAWYDDVAINDSTGATDATWVGATISGQFARPTTDVTDGTWTDQAGGVSLFAAIDEVTSSDADYIQSANATATADVSEIALGTITDPAVSTGHVVRYRYGKDTAAGDVVNLTVSLRQGTATEIAAWTHTDIGVGPITVAQTLTAAQADAVTDYSALRLRFSSITV